jgi:tetratricopeptide (TPR) repeat protein
MLGFVHRGLDALGNRRTAERGGLLALWGAHASQRTDYDRAVELLSEALDIAREQGDEHILGLALYSFAVHYFNFHEHEDAIRYGTESIEHLRATNDLWSLANVLGYVATSHQWQGRFETGSRLGAEGEALALRLGNWSAWVFSNRPHMYVRFAREPSLDWYEEDGRRALELGEQLGFEWLLALGHTRLGVAAFWRGNWEEALERTEAASHIDVRGAVAGFDARIMYMHAYLGHRAEALSIGERIRERFAVAGRPNPSTSLTFSLTALESYAVLGERAEAAAIYPVVVDVISRGLVARGLDYRLTQTLAGIAAWCGGDWELAEGHFEQGLRVASEAPLRLEEPECQRFYVQALIEHGDPADRERARVLGAEAIASYRRIGMPRHEALVTSMLEQL